MFGRRNARLKFTLKEMEMRATVRHAVSIFYLSDHVMPSWKFSFCFVNSYAHICTCIRHLNESVPSSSITWSEMRKQNIQAKEVYYNIRVFDNNVRIPQ